jgi:hypothetical protein
MDNERLGLYPISAVSGLNCKLSKVFTVIAVSYSVFCTCTWLIDKLS